MKFVFRMITTKKSNWLVPFALIMLSIVPMLAGAVRLFQIGNAAPVTSENLRFMSAPLPVVMHIIGSVIYSILGAFQFSDSFRRNKPLWHRTSGKWLIPLGLISALSGIWMTLFYARPAIDGELIVATCYQAAYRCSDVLFHFARACGYSKTQFSSTSRMDDSCLRLGFRRGHSGLHAYSMVCIPRFT